MNKGETTRMIWDLRFKKTAAIFKGEVMRKADDDHDDDDDDDE